MGTTHGRRPTPGRRNPAGDQAAAHADGRRRRIAQPAASGHAAEPSTAATRKVDGDAAVTAARRNVRDRTRAPLREAGRRPRWPSGRSCASRRSATPRRPAPPGPAPADGRPAAATPQRRAGDPDADRAGGDEAVAEAQRRSGGASAAGRNGGAAIDGDQRLSRAASATASRSGRYLMCVQVRPGGPGRRARGAQPDRALRQPAGRRHQPDPRQHLRRPGAERAARHGGRVRRHRHAEERVLYRGDVQYDAEDIEERSDAARIEDILQAPAS